MLLFFQNTNTGMGVGSGDSHLGIFCCRERRLSGDPGELLQPPVPEENLYTSITDMDYLSQMI